MKRETFLIELTENILLPYEASGSYEEELVGEFENELEELYFHRFLASLGEKGFILDLACGDGRHTLRLSEAADYVVALDLSPNNLRKAMAKCRKKANVAFLRGSMFALPFASEVFDGIWFSQGFEYVPPDRRKPLLSALRRILKPGGILYMSVETWMYPDLWASLKELWSDFKLFFYWKFIKRKPLLWGEYLYWIAPGVVSEKYSGWHYHVHTDKWTLLRSLKGSGFSVEKLDLGDGYLYILGRK